VFDEAYKILTDINYREVFGCVRDLLTIKAPFVFLCGCLPPTLEPEFYKVTELQSVDVIRMPTSRPEIAYSVYMVDRKDMLDAVVKYMGQVTEHYGDEDRAMIFCRTKQDTIQVAEALNLSPVYAGLDSNEDVFQGWILGEEKVIVSTSLLGCGIDVPAVRDVINYGLPFTALDKHQQDNRAGRDGKPARAVMFVDQGSKPNTVKSNADFGASLLLPWAKDNRHCRRIFPSFYMDGVAEACTGLPNAELCDCCLLQMEEDVQPTLNPMPNNPFLEKPVTAREQSPAGSMR
jgi:Helicase conserved C-terminal domain